MENSLNITGRLTEDVQLKPLKSGNGNSALFTIACQRDFKNKKTGDYDADFFTVVAFNHNAELVSKYLGRGDALTIHGRLQSYHHQKDDGNWENIIEILLVHPNFVPSNNHNSAKSSKPKHDFSGTPNKKSDPFKDKSDKINISDDGVPF